MKQCVPETLVQLVVSPTAPPAKRGRGRPPKQPTAALGNTRVRKVRRSDRVKAAQTSPPTPLITTHPEMVDVKSGSAITKQKLITGLLAKCMK